MTIRTTRKTLTFSRPFVLSAVDTALPSGAYTVDTDEELIGGLSFLAYRRIATLLHLPSTSNRVGRSASAASTSRSAPTPIRRNRVMPSASPWSSRSAA